MNKTLADLIGLGLLVLAVVVLVGLLKAAISALFQWQVIYEYQRGLLFENGKLKKVLLAGSYFVWKPWQTVQIIDMRETTLAVTNQEIVLADTLALRFSTAIIYKVVDPALSLQSARVPYEILYLDLQLVLREAVAAFTVEEVLNKRNEISTAVLEAIRPRALLLGLEVTAGGVKDVTLPAEVRRIYSQVMQAEKSAQANMAKAKAEVASLRALANAAKMMDNNPNLLHLRTLQSISELSSTAGNTFVVGMPPAMMPMPRKPGEPPPPPHESD